MSPLAEILERLVPMLGALEGEATPLEGGITNRNYVARLGGEAYVIRLPGKDTGLLEIDRGAEREANEAAARAGVGPAVAALLEDPPCLVTHFVEGREMSASELREPAALERVAALLAALHGGGARVSARFSPFRIVETYAERARGRAAELPAAYRRALATAARIEAALPPSASSRFVAEGGAKRELGGREAVLCHNDLLAANFLRSGDGIRIVDWEYAGMGNRWFDLGNFAVNNELGAEQEEAFLAAYLGQPAGPSELASLRLMRFMSDFREAMWGVLQGTLSDLDFDFAAYAARHFDRLDEAAADPRFEAALGDVSGGAS